jgi:outer membrane lipoprotein-sorting protein
MNAEEAPMSVMASRPLVRWALPVGVVIAVAAAGAVTTALRASADVTLPQRSAAQLLVDLQTADLTGAYGTVVETADLGLPSLPQGIGGQGSSDLNSMITGSHTLRVWYSGPDKTRVALLGALGESDVIRDGTDVWMWSSQDNTATHVKLGAEDNATKPGINPTDLPSTPQQAADEVLAALDPTTNVTTEPSDTVAGRGTYELALSPKDTGSLIGKIRIGIDGAKHVPTRVQVYAKGAAKPNFEIAFSQVSFKRPDNGVFAFNPPPGAKVNEPKDDGTKPGTQPKAATIGQGWTTVLAARMPAEANGSKAKDDSGTGGLDAFLGALPQVHGSWGSGRVLQSKMFSVLLTDDGRVLIGAVTGDQLQKAAADPKAALN